MVNRMSTSSTYAFSPDRAYFMELLRPWKLATFAFAMALLLYGALNFNISDWDVGVTLIMGGLTYLCEPWSVSVLFNALRYRPRYWWLQIIAALLVGYVVVDLVYWVYHTVVGNRMLRAENFRTSSAIYLMAGVFWQYRGSLRELFDNIRQLKS